MNKADDLQSDFLDVEVALDHTCGKTSEPEKIFAGSVTANEIYAGAFDASKIQVSQANAGWQALSPSLFTPTGGGAPSATESASEAPSPR